MMVNNTCCYVISNFKSESSIIFRKDLNRTTIAKNLKAHYATIQRKAVQLRTDRDTPKTPGYKIDWSVGYGKNKIDEIYPGKTEAIITQVFGPPAQKQGEYWTYRGLKVRNMKRHPTMELGSTFTTVIFQMQNGKVARVIVQP